MNHVFLHCTQEHIEGQGSEIVIPGGLVYRWSRQMDTPYDKLSEEEKDSDRKEADKVLAVLGERLQEKALHPIITVPSAKLAAAIEDARLAMTSGHFVAVPVGVVEKWLAYIEESLS